MRKNLTLWTYLARREADSRTPSGNEKSEEDDDPHAVSHFEAHLEGHIPWRLRFEHNPVLVPGMWALLRTKLPEQEKKPPKLNPNWKRKPRPVTEEGIVLPLVLVLRQRLALAQGLEPE